MLYSIDLSKLETQEVITVDLQEVEDGSPPPETHVESRAEAAPTTKSQPPPPPSPSPSHSVMTGKGKRKNYHILMFVCLYSVLS